MIAEMNLSSSTISDCTSIEELVELFAVKTGLLRSCLEVRDLNCEDSKILKSIDADIAELRNILNDVEKQIERAKENLALFKALNQRVCSMKTNIKYAEDNFPKVLQNFSTEQNVNVPNAKKNKPLVTSVAATCKKSSKTPLTVKPLSLSEFNSISDYMKGRLTYESINKFVEAFNKAIIEKYKLLHMPRNQLKNLEHKTVQEMKRQETNETKGLFFCVLDDIKTYGNIKPNKSTETFLTIMRHCSRIKEVRGPGPIKRYVVQNRT